MPDIRPIPHEQAPLSRETRLPRRVIVQPGSPSSAPATQPSITSAPPPSQPVQRDYHLSGKPANLRILDPRQKPTGRQPISRQSQATENLPVLVGMKKLDISQAPPSH